MINSREGVFLFVTLWSIYLVVYINIGGEIMSGYLTNKFVAVLNKKIEPGKAMNALAHMSAGLVAKYPDKDEMRFGEYVDADGNSHDSISDHPFVVLSAKNSNKLRTLREELEERDICFVDFTDTMTVGTYMEQKERTSQTPEQELEYYGVCVFGNASEIGELTKKFSLWG